MRIILKKTVHNLFNVTTNAQGGVLGRRSSEALNKILEKYLRKSFYLAKYQK